MSFLDAYHEALDGAYDREQKRLEATERQIQTRERMPKGDSFELFCRQQRARLGHRLEAAVTRVRQHRDEVEVFESRK